MTSSAFGSFAFGISPFGYTTPTVAQGLTSSETWNNIGIDNRTFIDRAYGALRLRPQQITAEMQQIALDVANLVQLDMLNDACPLWTQKKHLVTLSQGKQQYQLPASTNDVRAAFFRSMSNLTGSATATYGTGSYQFEFPQPTQVTTVSLNWPSASFLVQFQTSPDGVNWTTVAASGPITSGQTGTVFYDIDNANTATYWQAIPAASFNGQVLTNTFPSGLTGQVYNMPQDVLMYRMNKDDYWNLTTKTFQGRPLQFWLDRQIVPQMDVWPAPDFVSAQQVMVVWRQAMLMDVGSLQNTLNIAPRWYLAFFYRVAAELGLCTPEADPTAVQMLQARSDQAWRKAWLEERDNSPVKFQTNIGAYTR